MPRPTPTILIIHTAGAAHAAEAWLPSRRYAKRVARRAAQEARIMMRNNPPIGEGVAFEAQLFSSADISCQSFASGWGDYMGHLTHPYGGPSPAEPVDPPAPYATIRIRRNH